MLIHLKFIDINLMKRTIFFLFTIKTEEPMALTYFKQNRSRLYWKNLKLNLHINR